MIIKILHWGYVFNFSTASYRRTEFDSQGWHNFLSVHGIVESSTQFGIRHTIDFNIN